MPIIKSAIKRAKQTIKRRERNVGIKREIKDATKAFMAKPSAATLSAAQSEIDTAVKKGLIKKNTAARRKSSLFAISKAAGVKFTAVKKEKVAAKPAVKAATKPAPSAVQRTAVKKAPAAAKKAVPKSAVQRTAAKKAAK